MQETKRVAYAGISQLCAEYGIREIELKYTTLNERWNIYKSETNDTGNPIITQYIGIGNGGHAKSVTGGTNKSIGPLERISDAGTLYDHLPWIMRAKDNDLTDSERNMYRMRRYEEYDGKVYVSYYLKKFDITGQYPTLEKRERINNVTTVSAYDTSPSTLHPAPPITGTDIDKDIAYSSSLKIPFELTQMEVESIREAANIISGEPGHGVISEIGLFRGVDKEVLGNFNGHSRRYIEAIKASMTSSLNTYIQLEYGDPVATYTIDVGTLDTYTRS